MNNVQQAVTGSDTQQQFEFAVRRAKWILPLYIVVPALFALGFYAGGVDMDWKAFGLGALGWFVALLLRGPVSALAMKMPREKGTAIVTGSSGVLEEGVRVAMLLLTSTAYGWAVSFGQGWAAVEVLFVMVNVIALAALAPKTDEKSMQAKEMLKQQGQLSAGPIWGVIERVFASAFHIGCTLLVAKYPWSAAALIPLHSFVNLAAVKYARISIYKVELLMAIAGTVMLAVGIAVSV
ncbi:YhfC family intramembrane metalloprotease [Cohnella ginsengisoli]|uniref:YhfC family intramembrane metalloprotease n=1 Tax=Cohnella ginsengisoli TaxID=425004 RepID=A0A9X4KLF2_9BACL|nr:YhfC family glutamic-type intramembrane protease [Cohnella ginsengisoli]MDG0794036.1 YhfC family intramembrane metalloprotease [Cohnella ginsengisoli]